MKMWPIVYFIILVFGSGTNALSAQSLSSGEATKPAELRSTLGQAYALRIAPGDLIDVAVFDTPDLSTKVRVDAHGMITLPLGGDLRVSGMTAEEAGHAVEARLSDADILKAPHVSVTVLEYATQGVTVLGEVKNPGVYPLLGARELLDLISAAGGMTPDAGETVTITHRDDPSHPVIVNVRSKATSTGAFNVGIRPGDTIMVSRAGIVYVLGDVAKPGGFMVHNNYRLTILQAIALAQGTNHTASLNHAKLIRRTETGREELSIPLKKILSSKAPDQELVDGDILFVPQSGAKTAVHDFETILPSAANAAIYRVP